MPEGGGALPPPVERLVAALPGLRAEDVTAASPARVLAPGRAPRPAAVLLLLSPGSGGADGTGADAADTAVDGLDVVLVERAGGRGAHAGQVALPGGGVDAADASPAAAALREAAEECGLDDDAVVVLGALPALAVPVSGYLVVPVLAWQPAPTPLAPGDPREITAVHRVPLAVLADPGRRVRVGAPLLSGAPAAPRWTGPGFVVGDLLVWGFTALVLDAVLRLAGLERPWSQERVVDPPRRFAGASTPR